MASGPDTYQKKPTNRLQIESLMDITCRLVSRVQRRQTAVDAETATPLVMDIGAGKALLTRAIYEALDRRVAAVALDSRAGKKASHRTGDRFYDPDEVGGGDAPYTRVVADVRHFAARTVVPLRAAADGGVIAVTKHLCGGATNGSIEALCRPPLDAYVGACCLAPCCHQKTKREQYCNIAYLESLGFCETHIGKRGSVEDNDFKNFGMLINMSRAKSLKDFEYKHKGILEMLGFSRSAELRRKARRLLEEGRLRYLRDHGF